MKLCLFTEKLNPPYDEGYKNFTLRLFGGVPDRYEVLRLGSGDPTVIDRQVRPDVFCLNSHLRGAIRDFRPDALVYIPISSATSASLLRARVLKRHARNAPVALVGLQPRHYSGIIRPILRAIAPDVIYAQSEQAAEGLRAFGLRASVVYCGVDSERFQPVEPAERTRLRKKYGIAEEKRVVLHVGHIRERRNVRVLSDIASVSGIEVVLVGSTSTEQDAGLANRLTQSGVRILDRYIERIEEVYQLADVYVFPVDEPTAAVEMPLSVLEAMACNLPVVTTRFGGLADCFTEGDGLYFAGNSGELMDKLKSAGYSIGVNTRSKVEQFTWQAVAERFYAEIEQLAVRPSAARPLG